MSTPKSPDWRADIPVSHRTPSIRTTLVTPAFIQTSLFDRIALPSSWLFNFLAPPLEPHVIVKEIVDALDCHESRIIRLPWYTNFARFLSPGVGVFPKWLGDLLQWIAGANHAMKDYGPKPDAAERMLAESNENEPDFSKP